MTYPILHSTITGKPIHDVTTGKVIHGDPANCGCCAPCLGCGGTQPSLVISIIGDCENQLCWDQGGVYNYRGGGVQDYYCEWDWRGPDQDFALFYFYATGKWNAYSTGGYFMHDPYDFEATLCNPYTGLFVGSLELKPVVLPDNPDCSGCTAMVTFGGS